MLFIVLVVFCRFTSKGLRGRVLTPLCTERFSALVLVEVKVLREDPEYAFGRLTWGNSKSRSPLVAG